MIKRAQGASLENESQTVARSLAVASVGLEKRTPVRGERQTDMTPAMRKV